MDEEVLTRELTKAEFAVEKCTTINRGGSYPKAVALDGREGVGAVARKKR